MSFLFAVVVSSIKPLSRQASFSGLDGNSVSYVLRWRSRQTLVVNDRRRLCDSKTLASCEQFMRLQGIQASNMVAKTLALQLFQNGRSTSLQHPMFLTSVMLLLELLDDLLET